jgi:hypothetical protein
MGKKVEPPLGIGTATTSAPKFSKPRIFLADLPDDCGAALRKKGYNVKEGSFGRPYRVARSDDDVPVHQNAALLGFAEEEIVFVNLARPASQPMLKPEIERGVVMPWQSCASGLIDSRPLTMREKYDDAERILNHGGFFVFLAGAKTEVTYRFGSQSHGAFDLGQTFEMDNWSLLWQLSQIEITNEQGQELEFTKDQIGRFLARWAEGATYHCAMKPRYDIKDKWMPLATNKYGGVVAAVLGVGDPLRISTLILPQMPRLSEFVVELVENLVADFVPALFPDMDRLSWVHRPEYEVPCVAELIAKRETLVKENRAAEDKAKQEIAAAKEESKHWYALLHGTGAPLVAAVIDTLGRLGFKGVVDVDAEAKKSSKTPELREDIQIKDRKPTLVVDVKGVNGTPSDGESMQAYKHAGYRMREWKTTEVQPLTIINHQRHIPPRERDQQAYRDEIIGNAIQDNLGLMTTWDLFRILRNREKLGWPNDAVQPIFYRIGRIEPIPEHYVLVGVIDHTWLPAFRIKPTTDIKQGATLAIETGDTFEEVPAVSLRIDDQRVDVGREGAEVSIGCEKASERFRAGQRVFLVKK